MVFVFIYEFYSKNFENYKIIEAIMNKNRKTPKLINCENKESVLQDSNNIRKHAAYDGR